MGLIGCVIAVGSSPREVLGEASFHHIDESVFFSEKHRLLWSVMDALAEEGDFDMIVLQSKLKDMGKLDAIGGLDYLVKCQDSVPSRHNLPQYARIVMEKFCLRRIIQEASALIEKAQSEPPDFDGFIDEAEAAILKAAAMMDTGSESKTIKSYVEKALDNIEKVFTNQGRPIGIPTGFADVDKLFNGMNGGEMIVIAARPGCGKTSIAMNMVEHVALEMNLPVGVFSLEMTGESLIERMLLSRSRISRTSLYEGHLTESDFPKITSAARKLATSNLHIDDTSGISIFQLKSRARKMFTQHGIKLLIVDYLQLLRSTNNRATTREQEISDISRELKGLSKELGIPVIALAQLNRELDKDKNRKPRLSDLRESGSIEQDADRVAFLYNPNRGDDEEEKQFQDSQQINLLIEKQRNGPRGEVPLTFIKSLTRFESFAKIDQSDANGWVPER